MQGACRYHGRLFIHRDVAVAEAVGVLLLPAATAHVHLVREVAGKRVRPARDTRQKTRAQQNSQTDE